LENRNSQQVFFGSFYPTANAGEAPGQVHQVLPSLHRVKCRFKSTKSCGHKALNGSHFDAAEFSLMSSYLNSGCVVRTPLICPACAEFIKGRRGKQKICVVLDHLLEGCRVFKVLQAGTELPATETHSYIEPGALTHHRPAPSKEKSSVPEGLLEAIDWDDERSFQVGLTLQGQKMLVVGGFPFVKALISHPKNGGPIKINWRCQNRRCQNRKCKTYMTTLGSDIKDYPPDDHTLSHDSNPLAASISAVRQKLKNAAVSSLGKPNKIVSDAVSTADETTRLLVGTQRALKQVIHRERQKKHPKALKDALDSLDIDWIATEMRPLSNETFVVCDDKTPGSRMIMFASQAGLKRLVFSLNWYGDGTFRVVPRFEWQKVFHQLYTLSGEIMDRVFGSVYCLLEKKDKAIYCKIFSFILHWAEEYGYPLTIKVEGGRIKTDLGE